MIESIDCRKQISRLQREVDGLVANIVQLQTQNERFGQALQQIAVSVVRPGTAASELQKIAMRALE